MIKAYINGKIYTSFQPVKIVNGLVVANERIIYTGNCEKAMKIARELQGEIIDLKGRIVLPGFIDSHIHLTALGQSLQMLNLKEAKSIEELKKKLKEYSAKVETSWILGFGWDQERLGRYPTRKDIDEIIQNKPVLLYRTCFHVAVLNSKAIEITKLNEEEDVDLEKGIVRENALEKVRKIVNKTLSVEDYKHFIEKGVKFALSQGITSIGFVSVNEKSLKALIELDSEEKLPIRVFLYLNPSLLKTMKKLGLKKGTGGKKVKIMGIKVLADGSLGARTAWLSKPYADVPTNGHLNISEEELRKIVKEAHALGLQMAIHAIGDKTTDMILRIYEEFKSDLRPRIEHASILREDQMKKMRELGVVTSVQPRFIISDWWAVKRVGKERAGWIYPFKKMLKRGIPIGFGTDSPIEPINPWESVYAVVTRGKFEGIETYEYTKEECLSLEEAMKAYTYGSAYIMYVENELGSLENEKFADFIVVDKDPFEVNEKELKSINVLETYVGGLKYY